MLSTSVQEPAGLLSAQDAGRLLDVVQELSGQRTARGVIEVVRRAARELTGADGVTFVLREGELVHYAEENAIGRLWKGQRFPANACISGWAMIHREPALIEDVFADPRIPHDLYRPTFVRSLAMVPVRLEDPVAAIGAYWARHHRATPGELRLLQALAASCAVALENARLWSELQQAVHLRDEFLNIAAHELRTPLTPLKMQVQALARALEREGDPEAARRGAWRVEAGVRRMERLVEHLLDRSRLAQGGLLLDCEDLDLAQLAREAAERNLEPARQAGCALEVHAPEPVRGVWDRLRLERVLDSLLSNALRFGAGRPIELRAELDADRASLTVRDGGPGISDEDRERVFGPFERASSPHHFGGFGLGLWIVRQNVEAHHGEVLVESAPGAGSAFRVLLPRQP